MSEIEYKNLTLDYRMYQYIRNNAITNPYDAIVELLTNCVDAYSKTKNNTSKIEIDYYQKKNIIKVRDFAIGLTSHDMEKSFLTVGEYLSNNNNRGHFSRGAKDISAIGNVIFTAIKDNKISQCKIKNNGTGAMIIKDQNVSKNDRKIYRIKNNGLEVKLELTDTKDLKIDWNLLKKHYALRDILSSDKYNIFIRLIDDNISSKLTYHVPKKLEKIVNVEYQVPYYNVPAKFEVWLDRHEELSLSNDQKFSENGFLIKSFNTIYENSLLNKRIVNRHPKFTMLCGVLSCDYINTLLKDYEKNGSSKKNPLPIIDNSRMSGLSMAHPFTKHLLRLPEERVLHILTELQYENDENEKKLNLTQMLAGINDLEILGEEVFTKLNIDLLSDFYIKTSDKDNFKSPKLNKIMHSGKEENLSFSKENINKRKKEMDKKMEDIMKTSSKLEINFTSKKIPGKFEYSVSNNGISINIPQENPVVKRYLGNENDGYIGTNDTRFLITMADIITESFAKILSDSEIQEKDNDNLTPNEYMDLYNSIYNKYYNLYEQKIYDVILN